MVQEDTCISMFTAALFTIAKAWDKPKCPSTEEWIKMWYIYTMESVSHENKWHHAIYNNMDGPRDYPIKWGSDRERQIPMILLTCEI